MVQNGPQDRAKMGACSHLRPILGHLGQAVGQSCADVGTSQHNQFRIVCPKHEKGERSFFSTPPMRYARKGAEDESRSSQDGLLGSILGPKIFLNRLKMAPWVILGKPWANLVPMLLPLRTINFGQFLTSIFETFLLPKWSENDVKIRAKIEPNFCPVLGYVFD